MKYSIKFLFATFFFCSLHSSLLAQDTSAVKEDSSVKTEAKRIVSQRKEFIEKMMRGLHKDTTPVNRANILKRNEVAFNKYEGMIIRNISVQTFPFGVIIGDTSKRLNNSLTKAANYMHHQTRLRIIKNNLFFSEGQTLNPYMMADNVTFLRQLPYLQDAEIKVIPIAPGSDSVDIVVQAKDVFSLGVELSSLGIHQTNVRFGEANFAGTGNAAFISTLYDDKRRNNFGLGGEYNSRNMGGSFLNGLIGYQSAYPTFAGPKEENMYYASLSKPLINRYMKWVYELDVSYHSTRNFYNSDSVYKAVVRYRYYNMDGWLGYNINWRDFTIKQESEKLRKLIGIRLINQKFQEVPEIYKDNYYWQYADLAAVLTTLTFYRQNFYKTQYVYGFGHNEDIPEGLYMTFTSGFTIKQSRHRPFLAFDYRRSQFNRKNNYISFALRAEGYFNKNTFEDINLVGALGYFDHLKAIGPKWKQRFFLNIDAAQQINSVLNEPLYPNSKYGWPEYGNRNLTGNFRTTLKLESEFFSPWSLIGFRLAPLLFYNFGAFSPYHAQTRFLSSVGLGLRMGNESLTLGTIELRLFFFPTKNLYNNYFNTGFASNVSFKSTTQFISRPDFISVN